MKREWLEAVKVVFFLGMFLMFVFAWMDANRKWMIAEKRFEFQAQRNQIILEALAMHREENMDAHARTQKMILGLSPKEKK